jgi:hypothetical protein
MNNVLPTQLVVFAGRDNGDGSNAEYTTIHLIQSAIDGGATIR